MNTDIFDRIQVNPAICNGKPIVRGLRITVRTVLEYLASGESISNVLEAYPYLEIEDIYACLQFAAFAVDRDFVKMPLRVTA